MPPQPSPEGRRGAGHFDGYTVTPAGLIGYRVRVNSSPAVLVTGAAGFLGSAVTVDLARDYRVAAVDVRRPTPALVAAAPAVLWLDADVGDATALGEAVRAAAGRLGAIDFVIHLAAYYHFGIDPRPGYGRVNVAGTRNVAAAAKDSGARRMVFASSLMALDPAPPGQALSESSPATSRLPYGSSKAAGEAACREAAAGGLPAAVLRIGGVFSDWCELPPLHSLMRTWGGRGPLSRVVPGRGHTGFAYVHRDDLVRLVRRTIERHERLGPCEVLMASQDGAVTHNEIFAGVRRIIAGRDEPPLRVPAWFARLGLYGKVAAGRLVGRPSFEQPWMMDFADRPLVVDAARTREILGWETTPELRLPNRLPVLMRHFLNDRAAWDQRNHRRNAREYEYPRPV